MPSAEITSFLPLSPRAFYVLIALAEEDSHGYALAKRVEVMSLGTVRLTGGTLYPLIRQMLADGWIAETGAATGDPRRRPYRLTPRGRRIGQAEAARLTDVLRAARASDMLPKKALG